MRVDLNDGLAWYCLGENVYLCRSNPLDPESFEIILSFSLEDLHSSFGGVLIHLDKDLDAVLQEQCFQNLSSRSIDQDFSEEIDYLSKSMKLNKDLISHFAIQLMSRVAKLRTKDEDG